MNVTKEMVDRFLTWPVPADVYPDGTPGQPGRSGTNLLTATQAKEMLEHVLGVANGYCSEGERCVCGGDLPRVREGCANWVPPNVTTKQLTPLRKLGKRLSEMLDEDQWAECEALLLAAGITPKED